MYKNATFNIALEPMHFSIKDSMICDLPDNTISQRMKKLRISLGLTQDQLGTMIGNKNTTVANWENGHKTPLLKTQEKIIKTFNLPKDFFNF